MKKKHHPAYWPYLGFVSGSGLTLLVLSIVQMNDGRISSYWLILASLTVFISALAIKIPQIDCRISVEDTLVFTNLILFGPQVGIVTATLQGLVGSLRAKSASKRPEFVLFNGGGLALSTAVSGYTFFSLIGMGPIIEIPAVSLSELVLPITAMALTHYLCNSGTVSVIIALDSRQNIFRVWSKNFSWASISYFTAASVAALITVNLKTGNWPILIMLMPIILIIYFAYKTYKDKMEGQIRSYQELNELYQRTVESLALAVDAKDQTTYGHIQRVRSYSMGLARLCNITDTEELQAIETASLLHDIGKLAVADYILNKPGRLSEKEFDAMKIHTIAGEEILTHVQFPHPVAKIVRSHHERWDGKGYPDGLAGEEISLGARILMVADTFDALRSPRPYKPARSTKEALKIMLDEKGSMYDPHLVDLFLANIDQLEKDAEAAVQNMSRLSYRSFSIDSKPCECAEEHSTSSPVRSKAEDHSIELVLLSEFCASLAGHLNLSDFLVNLECRIRRLLPFTSCAFFLDSGDNHLYAAHAGGKYADTLRDLRIQLSKGVSGWVAAYNRSIISNNQALEFGSRHSEFQSISSVMAVPIIRKDICLGTISLYAETHITYAKDQLKTLQFVAEQVAPVLEDFQQGKAPLSPRDFVDPVTETYRASYLGIAGTEILSSCGRNASRLSLVYLKLRKFQEAVELWGPQTGDRILHKAAKGLKGKIRDMDLLVRFGKDGFVILLSGVEKDQISCRVEQIQLRLAEYNANFTPEISFRAGMASYPEDGDTVFALLDAARRDLEAQESNQNVTKIHTMQKVSKIHA